MTIAKSVSTKGEPKSSTVVLRMFSWMVLLLAISLSYWISSLGAKTEMDTPLQLEYASQQKLTAELAPLEKSGIIDERLLVAQKNLGFHYWYYDRYEQAEKQMKNRIETASALYGFNSAQRFEGIADLAALYRDWTKFDKANALYQDLLTNDKVCKSMVGQAKDLNNLGVLYCLWGQSLPNISRRMQKFKQSEAYYNDCLTLLKATHGSDGLALTARKNDAVLLKEMGRVSEAEALERQVGN